MGAFLKVIGVDYQLGILLGNIGKCHIKTKNLKAVIWMLKHLPVPWHVDKTSTQQPPNTQSLADISIYSGWFGWMLTRPISGRKKWAVWSLGLCFNPSQVRLGLFADSSYDWTLAFMVIHIYQFNGFCTDQNQKDLWPRTS